MRARLQNKQLRFYYHFQQDCKNKQGSTIISSVIVLLSFPVCRIVSQMKKYTSFPLTLYRIQPRLPVSLRSYDLQMAAGRSSFDLKVHNGLVCPIKPDDHFHTPNGMSLRPAGPKMMEILSKFPEKRYDLKIYSFLCGMSVPKDFVLYHEHNDHYSLQTAVPIPLDELNQKMTDILSKLPSYTRQQFIDFMNDPDDFDN